MEQLAAIDLPLAAAVGVHKGLGMRLVLRFGPERLRTAVAPHLAGGRQLAAFALTEPACGASPLARRTRARRCAGGWCMNGDKYLIGLANWAGWITINAELLYEYQTVATLAACLDARRAGTATEAGVAGG